MDTQTEKETFTGSATYCPEDNKLRLYVGRVPRDEYLKLRADGWTSTPKQSCDFVATWTPGRRNTCLEYAGVIGDEDQPPEERAADRAERFSDYRDKRTSEATGHADSYDAGPQVHGYQSEARAERSARRHDRIADRAGDAWSKAEYWQHRTAGVISHALYKSTPGVRMGRIKTIEAELRRYAAAQEQYGHHWNAWQKIAAIADPDQQTKTALHYCGHTGYHDYAPYVHPRTGEESTSLYCWLSRNENEHNSPERQPITGAEAVALFFAHHSEPAGDGEWATHYRLRLAYENQMLEAQGGRAAFVEMVPGGWIGSYQIRKVNKSAATGRVVSVNVMDPRGWSGFTKESGYKEHVTRAAVVTLNIERLKVDAYRAPTPEDLEKLAATLKAEKAAAPKSDPCPLINPTDAEAERLQAIWNERAKEQHCAAYLKEYGKSYAPDFEPATVTRITQATYSANSKGSYARAETRNLCALGTLEPGRVFYDYAGQKKRDAERGPALCKLRVGPSGGKQYTPPSVIILTDKPQKPFPAAVWEAHKQAAVEVETVNA